MPFAQILHSAAIAVTVLPALDIPDIQPDFDAPFLSLGKQVLSWVLAGGVLVAILAAIVSGMLIAFGGLSDRGKSKGWIALGISLLVAAILGSITALMAFAGNLVLV